MADQQYFALSHYIIMFRRNNTLDIVTRQSITVNSLWKQSRRKLCRGPAPMYIHTQQAELYSGNESAGGALISNWVK